MVESDIKKKRNRVNSPETDPYMGIQCIKGEVSQNSIEIIDILVKVLGKLYF